MFLCQWCVLYSYLPITGANHIHFIRDVIYHDVLYFRAFVFLYCLIIYLIKQNVIVLFLLRFMFARKKK